jgi:hypothetical protein
MRLHRPAVIAAFIAAACAVAADTQNSSDVEKSFKKAAMDSVGRHWYASIEANHKKLVPGTVRIHIAIAPVRKIVELRVVSNTSNKLAAQLSIDAIRRAQIPPVPPELLIGGAYQDDWDFKIYAH